MAVWNIEILAVNEKGNKVANSSLWIIRGKICNFDAKIARKSKKATVEYRDSSLLERGG